MAPALAFPQATGEIPPSPRAYRPPEDPARHAPNGRFAPDVLREACRKAGEAPGSEDAGGARFRSAAEMVEVWRGLDLPAWVAPYALRDARLGYPNGHDEALVRGGLSPSQTPLAARTRWGGLWKQKLEAARRRAKDPP